MRRFVKKVAAAAVTICVVTAGAVLGAGGASATACPSSYTCTWDGYDYQGNGYRSRYIKFTRYIPDYRSYTYAGTSTSGNDTASSISNNGTTSVVYAFKDLNCTGYSFALRRGTGDGNLSDNSGNVPLGGYYGFNNSITSAAQESQLTNCRYA